MTNVEKIKFAQNEPLLSYIEQLFEEKFSLSSSDRILNVIEIGCGSGDFTLIFKERFGNKVQVTAIDPSEVDIESAKKKTVDASVDFQHNDIFKFSSDAKYDFVLFTKSLHHCIPVDQAVKKAYDLLSEDGLFFAEEIYLDKMQEKDISWFFDRMDLLLQTECMDTFEEAIAKNMPSFRSSLSKMLNTSLPIKERWFRPHHHHHQEGHHHQHEHEHKEDEGHTHQHHPHQEHKDNHQDEHKHEHKEEEGHEHKHEQQENGGHTHQHHPHQEHKDEIVGSSAVIDAIMNQFGEKHVVLNKVPYFYQFLVFCGLKSNAVLQEFYKQEMRAVDSGVLAPLGIHIVSHK